MNTKAATKRPIETNAATDRLTEALEEKLSHPATSADFDLHESVHQVLADIGMTSDDSGGELTDEHKYIAPDLFTAETPLGTYHGMTDQIILSRTPGAYRTVLVPRGSSKPEWLPLRK